jgi:hypothetical protein
VDAPDNGVAPAPINGRHARPSEEESIDVEPSAIEEIGPGSGDSSEAVESNNVEDPGRESRRIARAEDRQITRAEKRRRPRAPLAEKMAAPRVSTTADDGELSEDSPPAPITSSEAAEALTLSLSGKKRSSGARTARRAKSKQESATTALEGADDHPALGALNRHLNMMVQQLETAHRVIGRVAAERDVLRQQLADLQGTPVEAIAVTSLDQTKSRRSRAKAGQSADRSESPADRSESPADRSESPADRSESPVEGIAVSVPGPTEDRRSRAPDSDEPIPPSGLARLNYFSVEDIAVARKRRQMFALALLVVLVGLWVAGRMGALQVPSNLSRESLAQLPLVGEFMTYFLAGWVLFRIVRVGGKGIQWVFPSESQKRKRR